jgi:hypothetical protein
MQHTKKLLKFGILNMNLYVSELIQYAAFNLLRLVVANQLQGNNIALTAVDRLGAWLV